MANLKAGSRLKSSVCDTQVMVIAAPADDIDPDYGQALRRAARAGVELFALGARVTASAIRVERELPVLL